MIKYLKGIIIEKQPPSILIEVNNIGYEIYIPLNTFKILPNLNEKIVVFTELITYKDKQVFFGFNKKQDLLLFNELIKINCIGPKLALSIISKISFEELINAIKNKKLDILLKVPGLGRKIANHLIIEINDKLHKKSNNYLFWQNQYFYNSISEINKNAELESVKVLIKLGYKEQEAIEMITKIISFTENNCESLVLAALRFSN